MGTFSKKLFLDLLYICIQTIYFRYIELKLRFASTKFCTLCQIFGLLARPLPYWVRGEISGARPQVGSQRVPKFENSISHISVSSAWIFKNKIGFKGNLLAIATKLRLNFLEILTLAVPRCHFVHFWTDFFYKNPQNSILTPS